MMFYIFIFSYANKIGILQLKENLKELELINIQNYQIDSNIFSEAKYEKKIKLKQEALYLGENSKNFTFNETELVRSFDTITFDVGVILTYPSV